MDWVDGEEFEAVFRWPVKDYDWQGSTAYHAIASHSVVGFWVHLSAFHGWEGGWDWASEENPVDWDDLMPSREQNGPAVLTIPLAPVRTHPSWPAARLPATSSAGDGTMG